MTKRLIIYLQTEHPESVSWATMNASGQIQQSASHGNWQDLSTFANLDDITVIVPQQDVLLTVAALPKLSRQRMLQALPFALEEKLIDDVHDLHFAIGDYQENNTLPVAVVKKQKMEQWLSLLKQVGIVPNKIIPATLALPYTPKNWHGCTINDSYLIRTDKYSGFVAEKNNLTTLLAIQLANTIEKPESLHWYSFANEPLPTEISNIILNDIDCSNKNYFEKIDEWIHNYSFINLLQGPFQAKQKTSLAKKIWLISACLFLSWIFLLFLNNLVSYFILEKNAKTTETAINQIYRHHFPAATSIVAPRERMEEKIKKSNALANKNPLLNLLASVGKSLDQSGGIRLQSLDFRESMLNLTILANSFNHLDTFSQSLKKQGLNVKQQNASMAGTEVKATLIISKGAS